MNPVRSLRCLCFAPSCASVFSPTVVEPLQQILQFELLIRVRTAGLPFRKVQSKAVGMGAIYGASLLTAILISTPLVQSLSDTCLWTSLRAASIRGALYANGGYWEPMGTGVIPSIGGNTYSLDYAKSFNTTNNTGSTPFTGPIVAGDMSYYDGTMFATDDAFYLFGYVQQAWPSQSLTSLTVVNFRGQRPLSLPTRPLDIKPIPQHQGRQSRTRLFL